MRCVKISNKGRVKSGAKVPKYEATLNCNVSSWKQAFDKLSEARIYSYTWTYEVCKNKQQGKGQKVRQKYQNMRHGHMRCVKISN